MSEQKRPDEKAPQEKYDAMSIAELEEALRQDARLEGADDVFVEELIYMMQSVTEKRRQTYPELYNEEQAHAAFEKHYRPIAEKGELLFYEDEPEAKRSGSRRKASKGLLAVLAAAIVFLTGAVVSSATDYDIWGRITDWTRGSFGTSENIRPADAVSELRTLFEINGDDPRLLPTYLPEDYSIVSNEVVKQSNVIVYLMELKNGNEYISIEYSVGNYDSQFYKDGSEPETRSIKGTEYYFFDNLGKQSVAWKTGGIVGTITYSDLGLDIERILKSIPG